MTIHLTLVAGTEQQSVMLAETLGKGILDSACTKTVGTVWVKEYLSLLNGNDRSEAEKSTKESSSLFRFGDGKESKSLKQIKLPMCIAGKRITMDVEVVDNDIPLL